jgi:uncharacterized membrane protein
MRHVRTVVRIGLAIVMAVSGIGHFANPRPYVQHLPEVVPFRAELVAITGVMELVLALGLIGPRRFQRPAGLATAAFLVLVFPANLYAAMSQVPIDGVPTGWIRWARLPFQVPLIAAALWSTAADVSTKRDTHAGW